MLRAAARELSEFCERRIGDGYLGAMVYEATGHEIIWAAEVVRANVTDEQFAQLAEKARTVHETVFEAGGVTNALGQPGSTVTQFQYMFVIQLPARPGEETRGVLLAFAPEVGRDLSSFIEECREFVPQPTDSDSPVA